MQLDEAANLGGAKPSPAIPTGYSCYPLTAPVEVIRQNARVDAGVAVLSGRVVVLFSIGRLHMRSVETYTI
jgi:hypothetical protein